MIAVLGLVSACTSPYPAASSPAIAPAAPLSQRPVVPAPAASRPHAGCNPQVAFLQPGRPGVAIGVKPDQPQLSTLNGADSYSGFDIDLANFIMQYTTGTTPAFSAVITKDREKRLCDGVLGLVVATYSDTPGRESRVEMAGPYIVTDQGILVRRGSAIAAFGDLKGKAVCTTKGSTTPDRSNPLMLPGAVGSLILRDDFSQCVTLLRQGTVQAVSTDLLILYGYQETSTDLIVVSGIDIPVANSWMVGLPPGDKSDCVAVLKVLHSFMQDKWKAEFETWFLDVVHADPNWATDFYPDQEPLHCT
jgi:glutamate transport system substrate-binding protein